MSPLSPSDGSVPADTENSRPVAPALTRTNLRASPAYEEGTSVRERKVVCVAAKAALAAASLALVAAFVSLVAAAVALAAAASTWA